jgi:hypothetical protein
MDFLLRISAWPAVVSLRGGRATRIPKKTSMETSRRYTAAGLLGTTTCRIYSKSDPKWTCVVEECQVCALVFRFFFILESDQSLGMARFSFGF